MLAVVGDRGAAEDATAEAFARAWAAWGKVGRHPMPHAWVVRTALNANVSSWRKYRREVPLTPGGEAVRPVRAADGDASTDTIFAETAAMDAVARLPKRQRQVVALRIFLDLDTPSTAKALGIAAGTVTAHLSRAIATLRETLTPAAEQENQQ